MTDLTLWQEALDEIMSHPTFYHLLNQDGAAVPCKICGCVDRWQYEPGADRLHSYFKCQHGLLDPLLPIQVVDTIPIHKDRHITGDKRFTFIQTVAVAHQPGDYDYLEILEAVVKENECYESDR